MGDVLRDHELRDLIERCLEARDALETAFEPTPAEFYGMADEAVSVLQEAANFLLRLRERP
jgi:hypothetical protein